MLDCQAPSTESKERDNLHCTHCEASGEEQVYWGIQLDQDLFETIISIYPEWFKDFNWNLASLTDMTDNEEENMNHFGRMMTPLLQNRDSTSPPKAEVDDASLQQAMDKNKESLKVKLMTRRPINQLVEQGIMPSLKVPPHFHEQRQKLERAKMGDILKNKIQRRPDRQELIQQHILEDTTVDPSLQDKQRQLKKARLADDLNDRLSHRPGPLELVKGNILQADETFAQAVKEGQIQFKRTCEGQSLRHPHPSFTIEEDSGSDGALSPPQDTLDQFHTSLASHDSMESSPNQSQGSPSSQGEIRMTQMTPINCISSPPSSQPVNFSQGENTHKESTTTSRNRKKSKPKSQPKTRTIKFHEYKGPPSALKSQTSPTSVETSYELLLEQQQLFLQWQLELQQKNLQMILPVSQQPNGDQIQALNNGQNYQVEQQIQDAQSLSPQKCVSKLEDMKVSDLKAELKKRNLPVSGSKPQLIERLKPYSDLTVGTVNNALSSAVLDTTSTVAPDTPTLPISVGGIILDTLPTLAPKPEPVTSIVAMDTAVNSASQVTIKEEPALVVYNAVPCTGQLVTTSRPSSAAPMDIDVNSCHGSDAMDCSDAAAMNENIVKLQQKQILELQRELQRSQLQLQQQQWLQQQQHQQQAQQALLAAQPVPIAPQPQQLPVTTIPTSAPQANTIDTKALQRLQQHLQQKFHQQQLIQHLQQQQTGTNSIKFPPGSPAMSAAVKANLAAFIHNQHISPNTRVNNTAPPAVVGQQPIRSFPGIQPVVFCQTGTFPNNIDKPRANSLPNGLGQQRTSPLPNFSTVITTKPISETDTDPQFIIAKPPPDYNEATKQLTKSKQDQKHQQLSTGAPKSQKSGRKSVKCQAVDDVLEILIKNGELPPSAAQEPPTPTTPETQKPGPAPPVFPDSSTPGPLQPQPPSPVLPAVSNCINVGSTGEAVTSLPSSVLAEADSSTAPTLDFDFHLELEDIETMDLGVLGHDQNDISHVGTLLPSHQAINETPVHCQEDSIGMTNSATDMDVELSDWLDVLVATPSTTVSTTTATQQPLYNSGGDPLLSNMANSHDTFDLFSLEDMDFKTPTDLNILSWDKVDYAT